MSASRSPSSRGLIDDAAAGYALLPVVTVRDGSRVATQDCVAEEVPVALIVNGAPHVVMMATPCDLADFALGFMLSEAIVASADEVEILGVSALDNGYEVSLRIPEVRRAKLADRRRNLVGRSGCGLCGSETIEEAMRPAPHVPAGLSIETAALHRALHALRQRQPINAVTGATHAAGWADASGRLLLVREDVGRHNALDKLIGAMSIERIDAARGFAVITSRASYEMVLKAATIGMPLLAAISAPTALAVRMAEEAGLTLVGYARNNNHVVYACGARLIAAPVTLPSEKVPA
ncbi:formate dehydrogenase accessory sulfurtransferase FdhD [Nevskia sp.]|uniref:formate dehydrogenase accessory sulfurtransferase FdhD n=1 Tax=Nevskia sp. TaxID=1929292 RepID=UPI0025DF2DC8|nr:formate dehydrogenase accessory sulfurtransferase FdhD [Nevskia sp.]